MIKQARVEYVVEESVSDGVYSTLKRCDKLSDAEYWLGYFAYHEHDCYIATYMYDTLTNKEIYEDV